MPIFIYYCALHVLMDSTIYCSHLELTFHCHSVVRSLFVARYYCLKKTHGLKQDDSDERCKTGRRIPVTLPSHFSAPRIIIEDWNSYSTMGSSLYPHRSYIYGTPDPL